MTIAIEQLVGYQVEEPTTADAAMVMQFERAQAQRESMNAGLTYIDAARHNPVSLDFREYYDAFAYRLSDPTVYMRVVRESGGMVVGFLDTDIEPDMSYIRALYLAASVRSQGIGRRLLIDFEAAIPAVNRQPIGVSVLENNTRARHFYEREGYVDLPVRLRVRGYLNQLDMIKHREGEQI